MKQTDGWSSGLYRLAETTFRERIGMTDAERDQLASLGSPSWRPADPSWQIGAMQFEPMRGLDYGAYKAETRRRQSAAGSRTSELRTAASAARRATAIEMRSAGATQAEIARQLGVNQGTVSRWLSARVSDC
jgi:CRP-like cAMP-binding protein